MNLIARKIGLPKTKTVETNLCYERAFELIDLTSADSKWKGCLKELRRLREVIAGLYISTEKNGSLNALAYKTLIQMNSEACNLMGKI